MAELAINGGKRACDLTWPSWPIWDDEERKALNNVLESGQWSYGERVHEFEAKFAEFQGAKFGVTCTSGTTALEVALLALGVGAGDEVIVPSYTAVATASAVLRVNAIPVFADILPWTLCIDHDDVERKITDRTKAIIPVHLAGYVADMDRLREISASHNLFLVEDACHAWGSEWMGKGAGTLGKCGVFSFQATNNISSAEGGIIITNDEEVADACRSYTNCGHGQNGPWLDHFVLGSNLRMSEFQAAILLAQLTRLREQTARRQSNAGILTDGLRDVPGILTIEHDPRMTRRSYHFFPFRIDTNYLGVSRDRFVEALAAEGIPVSTGYTAPLYKNPLFTHTGDGPGYCPMSCPYYGKKVDYASVCCPVCEQVCIDTCWIPHTALLADEDTMDIIIDAAYKVSDNIDELK